MTPQRSLGAIFFDGPGERPERGKHRLDLRVAGLDLIAVRLSDGQRQLQCIDRIEAEPVAEQGGLRLDGGRIRLELERLYNQRGDFLLESKGGHSFL